MPMAKQQGSGLPWILDSVPLLVIALVVAHLLALVFWMYKLATDKPAQRKKTQ